MEIKEFLKDKLSGCESTFKQTSLDDSGNKKYYLCSDDLTEIYDFDKYVAENHDLSNLPASPDAIFLDDNKFYFVEFKNSPLYNISPENIKNKFNSGTTILKALLSDFLPTDYEFIFCVVYRHEKTKYFNSMFIESNVTKFGLEDENNNNDSFYNMIITQDIEFYKREFTQLECK